MYKKGTGNDKQGKDAGNQTLCSYRNFSQAIRHGIAIITAFIGLRVNEVKSYMCYCKND